MTPSLFYQEKLGRRFSVSLLAIEVYSIESDKAGPDDQLLYDALVHTIVTVCGINNPEEEDLKYFFSRLEDLRNELKQQNTDEKPQKQVKSFGTSYLKYLNSLSIDSVILRMTHYDLDTAKKLYCEVDRDDVKKLVSEYVAGQSEENQIIFEGAMYGFGGSYENAKGSKERDKDYDLNSKEGMTALRSLGF